MPRKRAVPFSENVTWGQRKRFSDGKVNLPYGCFLGYKKGADGLPEIVPEEVEIVRRIYRLFMQGKSVNAIANLLTREKIPTPGGQVKWQHATVESILTNEKYKGSALLQKSFTVDFLTKKKKINEGEVPQYYVEESHPAIIATAEWETVQAEMSKRKKNGCRYCNDSAFVGKIFCGDCGGVFGSKVWHSYDKYRRVIWQCNAKFTGEHKCETPHLTEEEIKSMFLVAVSEYLSDREGMIRELQAIQKSMSHTDFLDDDIRTAEKDLELLTDIIRYLIMENASGTLSKAGYTEKHTELCRRFDETEQSISAMEEKRKQMKETRIAIGGMLFELTEMEMLPISFDKNLWNAIADSVTVYQDERLVFRFKDVKEVTVTR